MTAEFRDEQAAQSAFVAGIDMLGATMLRAVAIMFVAMSLIPAGDTAGKLLSSHLNVAPQFVAWSRFALGAILFLPFTPPATVRLLRDPRIWFRALLMAGGILSIQFALKTEPLANVFAAFFVGPVLSYVLSALFLREPISPMRSVLVLAGFAGVLIVVRPGFGGTMGLGFAVIAGCCYGAFLTASRWLSPLGTPRALIATQLLIATLLLAPFGLTAIPVIDGQVSMLIALSATGSLLGNLLLLVAYAQAPATRLAPFVYFQLFAAAGLGWFVFDDLPDAATWGGLAIIAGSGFLSAALRR